MKVTTAAVALEGLTDVGLVREDLYDALLALAAALRGEGRLEAARERLRDLLRGAMMTADLAGRAALVLGLRGPTPARFAARYQVTTELPPVPKVVPLDAVHDLLDRSPVLAVGWEEVQRAYAGGFVFALARSTEQVLTERIQSLLANAILEGRPGIKTVDLLQQMGNWTRSYAETVYETNVTRAYAAGRHQAARQAADAGLLAALRFRTSRSPLLEEQGHYVAGTRPWHAVAENVIADVNDPIWDGLMPPLGYRCSCMLIPVDRDDIPKGYFDKRGKLKPARVRGVRFAIVKDPAAAWYAGRRIALVDDGFGRRADRGIYS